MKLIEMDFSTNCMKDLVSHLQLSGINIHFIHFWPHFQLLHIYFLAQFSLFFSHPKLWMGTIKSLSRWEVISFPKLSRPPQLLLSISSESTAACLCALVSWLCFAHVEASQCSTMWSSTQMQFYNECSPHILVQKPGPGLIPGHATWSTPTENTRILTHVNTSSWFMNIWNNS